MRKLLNKFLGVDEEKSLLPVRVNIKSEPTAEENPKLVVVKGEVHFEIFEDGNGEFRAKHKSGDWYQTEDHLASFFEYAHKFPSLERAQRAAMKYVLSRQLTKVGTVEFIPYHE